MYKLDDNYIESMTGAYLNDSTYRNNNEIQMKFDKVNNEFGKKNIIQFLNSFGAEIIDIEINSASRIVVRDKRFNKRISLNTYGDGILRAFHCYINVLSDKDGVTLIDEIENGLHWTKQKVLWNALHMIVSQQKQQLFVTTHSREMVKHLYETAKTDNFLNKVKLYRLEKKTDKIEVVSYSVEEFEYALSGNIEIR